MREPRLGEERAKPCERLVRLRGKFQAGRCAGNGGSEGTAQGGAAGMTIEERASPETKLGAGPSATGNPREE